MRSGRGPGLRRRSSAGTSRWRFVSGTTCATPRRSMPCSPSRRPRSTSFWRRCDRCRRSPKPPSRIRSSIGPAMAEDPRTAPANREPLRAAGAVGAHPVASAPPSSPTRVVRPDYSGRDASSSELGWQPRGRCCPQRRAYCGACARRPAPARPGIADSLSTFPLVRTDSPRKHLGSTHLTPSIRRLSSFTDSREPRGFPILALS